MPVYKLVCDKCEYAAPGTVLWGRFEYEFGDLRLPLDRKLGWCSACREIRAIEHFNPASWAPIESKSLIHRLKFCLRGSVTAAEREQEQNYEQLAYGIISSSREGQERCLNCGSQDNELFSSPMNLEYDSVYKGSQDVGFAHPGCGGAFSYVGSDLRLNVAFDKTKIYDVKGMFLREEEVGQ